MRKLLAAILASTALALQAAYAATVGVGANLPAADTGAGSGYLYTDQITPKSFGGVPGIGFLDLNTGLYRAMPIAPIEAPWALLRTGDTARGIFGAAAGGACDTSQWTAYIGGTASPQPSCYASKIAPGITIPFPAVVGIADKNGASSIVDDQTHIQYAQILAQGVTALGNGSQESNIVGNFISQTGGGGAAQTNWNEKVNLYLPTLMLPGGANTWAFNPDLAINAGVGAYPGFVEELDMTNFNGPYTPGGSGFGNAASTFRTFAGFPVTAGELWGGATPSGTVTATFSSGTTAATITSGTVSVGDQLTGTGIPAYTYVQSIGGSTTAVNGSGAIVLSQNTTAASASGGNCLTAQTFNMFNGFIIQGASLIRDATFVDGTNSREWLKLYGTHNQVIDTTSATVPYVLTAAIGQQLCLDGLDDCSFDIAAHVQRFTSNGGATLQLSATAANAYNGLQVTAANNGFGPTLNPFSLDSETNLALNLRSLGTGSITLGSSNGQSLAVLDPGSSPVNYLGMQGTPTGYGPAIKALGSDTNIPLNLYGKGASPVAVQSPMTVAGAISANGAEALTLGNVTDGKDLVLLDPGPSAVNYVTLQGTPTGYGPSVKAVGSDTNVPFNLYAQGAGSIFARSRFQTTVETDLGVASANYTQVTGASTGYGPIIGAIGSDTNVTLNLRGKGTGAVQALSGLVASAGFAVTGGNTQFGTYTASTSVTPTGYITIIDAGGTTRHLAVIP